MAESRRRVRGPLRTAAAVLVVPHELAHVLPAAAAGLTYRLTLLPEWEGSADPLWRFDADLDEESPLWLVRLVAVAPTPVFLGVALALRLSGTVSGTTALVAAMLCALWGTLSAGDLAVALAPSEARDAGEFLVRGRPGTQQAADALAVLTTLIVAGVLLL
ncbi:hypothetical protein RYH80_16785 [Halobaculum sp. MBLA0147]|uniref:hypothetical protein n=1 Tax=Halobaculum sp. MBLA0147 TaxID=3079934 RepID=UPI003523C23B